jgi:hypothetical protein
MYKHLLIIIPNSFTTSWVWKICDFLFSFSFFSLWCIVYGLTSLKSSTKTNCSGCAVVKLSCLVKRGTGVKWVVCCILNSQKCIYIPFSCWIYSMSWRLAPFSPELPLKRFVYSAPTVTVKDGKFRGLRELFGRFYVREHALVKLDISEAVNYFTRRGHYTWKVRSVWIKSWKLLPT